MPAWTFALVCLLLAVAANAAPPITTAALDANRALCVNGQPFFPIMIWLQDPANFEKAREAGCNTVAGYWPGSGGTKDVAEYLKLVEQAGLYGVMPFDAKLKGHPALLAYIHGDEPDLSHEESDAQVLPGEGLRVNKSAPLWKILDGVTSTWSVLDPMEGASLTIKPKAPVKLQKLVVWLTISAGLAVAKDVEFLADGKPLVSATLENKRGGQELTFAPVEVSELTFRVKSAYPGTNVWGSISEIQGLDAEGKNLLLSTPHQVARATPEETLKSYQDLRQADSTRPIFMTLTASFMPVFSKWPEEKREPMYRAYIEGTDAVGFDIYPLYGWGRADWIDRVSDGAAQLRELAGNRLTYQWIETSKGGQWVGEKNQIDVTPRHIRAEVWMAVCQGATAIGYFTHIWKPAYSQFGVPPENVAAMKQLNDQITRLSPVLLTADSKREVRITLAGDLKAAVLAKEHNGALYLFCVNCDPHDKGGLATLSLAGLKAGTEIEVVDEGRKLTAAEGSFTDDFSPLAVHIYKIAG